MRFPTSCTLPLCTLPSSTGCCSIARKSNPVPFAALACISLQIMRSDSSNTLDGAAVFAVPGNPGPDWHELRRLAWKREGSLFRNPLRHHHFVVISVQMLESVESNLCARRVPAFGIAGKPGRKVLQKPTRTDGRLRGMLPSRIRFSRCTTGYYACTSYFVGWVTQASLLQTQHVTGRISLLRLEECRH